MTAFKSIVQNLYNLSRYNMKIIFGGKFVYFILAAIIFFLVFGTITALDSNELKISDVYVLIAFPAILLVFYPSVFGIQNDADQRTLEIIFGIPDYRYKVWLVRYVMMLLLVFLLLIPFSVLAHWALISFPFIRMVLHLMVLVFFVSALGFCLSTIVKNGNGTAVIMVVVGLVLLILSDEMDYSKWNVLLNPFDTPFDIDNIVWQETIRQNRIFMMISGTVLLLLSLLNLQQREKFLK